MKKKEINIISINRQINYLFNVEKTIEAGISLESWEIKAIKARQFNIQNSYVSFKEKELYLFGATFFPQKTCSNSKISNIRRNIKLLLHKNEINYLIGKISLKKYTIVVISLYWKYIWIKVKIGIAIGRKKQDIRSKIKEKEWKLYKERITKNSYIN